MIPATIAPVLALLLAAPVPPPAAPPAAPGQPVPVAMTVSGGVSLGAYEAGYLYYATAALRANPGAGRLLVATGASAGSVNALLTLRAACATPSADPRESLFHRVWVPMGLRELFRPQETSAVSAFSQHSFVEVGRMVEAELALGLPEDCDVLLGVVASRMAPRLLEAAGGRLKVPVTEEHFALRIRGRGAGRMPLVTNYVDPDALEEQALLPEGPDGAVPFAALLDAVIASTSFPVAFPPRSVRHCVVRTRGRRAPFCPEAQATTALFVDGGVFDNSPMRQAAALAAGGLVRGPGQALRWRPGPDLSGSHAPPADVAFSFLSADAAAFPDQAASEKEEDASLLPLLTRELGGFVYSARSRELYLLVQDYPETARNLNYPRRHHPAASSPLYAFYGFFDRGFRAFDFQLGMYEARRQLRQYTVPQVVGASPADFAWPEEEAGARATGRAWAPLACLRAVYDGEGDPAALCAGDDLRDFRILAQVSIDRLWERCSPGSRYEPPPAEFPTCAPALAGRPPPRVPGVAGTADWRQRPDEGEATHSTRLLAAYGYRWSDIDVPPGATEERVLAAFRSQLAAVARGLAKAQPTFGEQVAVGAIGRTGVDLFYYVPPRSTLWLSLGRAVELGGDWAVAELSDWRLTGALEVLNLVTAFGSSPPPVAFAPEAGVEFLPGSWGSPVLQPSLLLRGGWLLSPHDTLGADACEGQDRTTIGACTRPVVEAGAAVAVTGILRLQLMAAWYPPARAAPGLWAILPSLGFQLGF